jgi:hypothetical protein
MPIQAQMMLGLVGGIQDAADERVGLMIGLGWTVRDPSAAPMAVSVIVYVPRTEMGHHTWRLQMTYADGEPFSLSEQVEGVPDDLTYEGDAEVIGLDDPSLTTALTMGVLIGLPPFPLPEGREYLWRLTVDGETRDEWVLPFRTSPPEALT